MKKLEYNETNPLYLSFFLAFLALTGTTMVTFLSTLSAVFEYSERELKNAFISETTVNVLAAFTYTYMINKISTNKLTLEEVTPVRYLDWVLTTPLLITSFVLYTNYSENTNKNIDYKPFGYIIPLNLLMLLCGYLGETKVVNFYLALFIGFIFYAILFWLIYDNYVKNSTASNKNLFYVFAFIWGLYGVSYLFNPVYKNISYNILDIVSKVGFGLYLWGATFEDNLSGVKNTELSFN